MAFETEDVTPRNRIAEALQGALSGAKQVVGLGQDIQNVQIQAERFKQEKFQAEEQRKALLEKQQLLAKGQLSSIKTGALLSDEPELYLKNKANDFMKYSQLAGSKDTLEDLSTYAKIKNPVVKQHAKQINMGLTELYTATPANTTQEAFKNDVEKTLGAYDSLIKDDIFSSDQKAAWTAERQEYLKQAGLLSKSFEDARQKDLNRKTLLEGKNISASGKAPGETTAQKAFGRTAGAALAKRVDMLATQSQRLNDLGQLKNIVNSTAVGPIAGKKFAQVIQRLGSKDAQRMKIFMNREQLNTILDFISVGGGTQIANSNVEREGIINSTVNPESDAEVVIEQINRIEGALREAVQRTQQQKKQLSETGSLLGESPVPVASDGLDKDAEDLLNLIGQ